MSIPPPPRRPNFADPDNELIGPIAAFIGARLQYLLPCINSQSDDDIPVSTIRVTQHKEKFFEPRVYCELAYPSMVQVKWEQHCVRANNLIPTEIPAAFEAACLKHDAKHYRQVHLDMFALIPRLRDKIVVGADYPELLHRDVDAMAQSFKELAVPKPDNIDHVQRWRYNYNVETNQELIELLASFYGR